MKGANKNIVNRNQYRGEKSVGKRGLNNLGKKRQGEGLPAWESKGNIKKGDKARKNLHQSPVEKKGGKVTPDSSSDPGHVLVFWWDAGRDRWESGKKVLKKK